MAADGKGFHHLPPFGIDHGNRPALSIGDVRVPAIRAENRVYGTLAYLEGLDLSKSVDFEDLDDAVAEVGDEGVTTRRRKLVGRRPGANGVIRDTFYLCIHTFPARKSWLLSRLSESSEQFVWLNRTHHELETQLTRSGIAPSIRFESSRGDLGCFLVRGLPWVVGICPGLAGRLLWRRLRGRGWPRGIGHELKRRA